MLLSTELQNFKQWASIKRDPITVKVYSKSIEKMIDFIGNKHSHEIKIEDLLNYYSHFQKKGYASATSSSTLSALRQFFKYLFYKRKINWDYRLVEVPRRTSKSYMPVEPHVAKLMIDNIDPSTLIGLRDKCILSMLYATGMRISELCELEIVDLNIKERKGCIISKKSKLARAIFWDKQTHSLLKKHLKQKKMENKFVFESMSYASKQGRGLSSRDVQRIIVKYRTDKNITAHGFRHGFGIRAVRAGMHIRFIQKLMGHKCMSSTQIYLNIAERDIEKAYRSLE